jgi:hypothetical protein
MRAIGTIRVSNRSNSESNESVVVGSKLGYRKGRFARTPSYPPAYRDDYQDAHDYTQYLQGPLLPVEHGSRKVGHTQHFFVGYCLLHMCTRRSPSPTPQLAIFGDVWIAEKAGDI